MEKVGYQDNRLFKFIVLAILIFIFVSVATIKIWELRIAAERVGIAHTLGSLRSALGVKLGELVIKKGASALGSLHHSNPMRLWNPPPTNYLGEFTSALAPVAQGAWYYDLDQQLLIYRLRFSDRVENNNPVDSSLLRFQVELSFKDHNNNGRYDPGSESASGMEIISLDNYRWKTELSQ